MKQQYPLFTQSVTLGIVCCCLRFVQKRTGFEPDTGLPIQGNLPALALPVMLAVSAAVLLALAVRTLPKGPVERPFVRQFDLSRDGWLTTALVGAGIMAFSGAWELADVLGGQGDAVLSADGMEIITRSAGGDLAGMLMAVMSIAAGACLLVGLLMSRRSEAVQPLPLMGVPLCLMVRLIFVYRVHSVNPVLTDYYLEVLSLAVLSLAFYRLSGFAVGAGSPRFLAAYTGMACVLALTLTVDGGSAAILHLGAFVALKSIQCMTRPDDAPPAAA